VALYFNVRIRVRGGGAPRVLAAARSKPTPILAISLKRKGVQGEAAKKLKGWVWVFFATSSFIQVPFHTPFNREPFTTLLPSLWRPEALRVDECVVILYTLTLQHLCMTRSRTDVRSLSCCGAFAVSLVASLGVYGLDNSLR